MPDGHECGRQPGLLENAGKVPRSAFPSGCCTRVLPHRRLTEIGGGRLRKAAHVVRAVGDRAGKREAKPAAALSAQAAW